MKGRRKVERIIAFILSLVLVWTSFSGVLPVSATTEENLPMDETVVTEAPVETEVVSELPTEEVPTEMATEEVSAAPTEAPTAAPTEVPSAIATVSGKITFEGGNVGQALAGSVIITGGKYIFANFTTDAEGNYTADVDISKLDDGKYNIELAIRGFNVTPSVSEIEIKDGRAVITEGADAFELNADLALADIDLIKSEDTDDVWVVNKDMYYNIRNYNYGLDYSYSLGALEKLVEFYYKDGSIKVTPQYVIENGGEITVNVSFNGVKKSAVINVGTVGICETSTNMYLAPITNPNVPEQMITVSVVGIDKTMPGTVTLSTMLGDAACDQGKFYIVKNGERVECADGQVLLSDCATYLSDSKTAQFVCYYVGQGKYANYGFDGEFTYSAKYSGVDNRYTASSNGATANYNDVNPIYFTMNGEDIIATTNNVEIEYGTDEYVVPVNFEKSDVEDYNNAYSYQLVDGNNQPIKDDTDLPYTIEIEEEVATVLPKRANKDGEVIKVKVTRESTKDGAEDESASAYLEVKIVPMTLKAVINNEILYASKTFDCTNSVTIANSEEIPFNIELKSVSSENTGILADDEADVSIKSITGTSTIKDATEGETDDVLTVTDVKLEGAKKDNYVVTVIEPTSVNIKLTIDKRKIVVNAGNAVKTYNADKLTPAEGSGSIITVNEFDVLDDGVSASTIILPEAIVNWGENVKETVGDHTDVVVPDITDKTVYDEHTKSVLKNYEFKAGEYGDLKVCQEEIGNVWEKYLDTSNYHTDDYDKIWFSINKTVGINFTTEAKDAYDVLLYNGEELKADGENGIIFAPDGLTDENGEYVDGVYEYKVRLAKMVDGEAENESKEFTIRFILDSKVPVAEINIKDTDEKFIDKTTLTKEKFKHLRFTTCNINNTFKLVDIFVNEMPVDESNESIASGLKTCSYAVASFDISQMPLDIDKMQDYIDSNCGELKWTTEEVVSKNSISIVNHKVGVEEDKFKAGSYVVFVKVEDNAGNRQIYASNGMVLEDNAPKLSITLPESKNIDGYYQGEVSLVIKTQDTEIASGIKNIFVHIAKNGDMLGQEELKREGTNSKNIVDSDSVISISSDDTFVYKRDTDVVDSSAYEIIEKTVKIAETSNWDIDDGYIEVLVEDYAGHITYINKFIDIDANDPVITVVQDIQEENNETIKREIESEDVFYVNNKDNTTFTFTIDEENYYDDGATLEVKKNETTFDYNGDQKDVVVTKSEKKFVVKIDDEAEGRYEFTLTCKDKSGRVSTKTICPIYDITKPTLSVEYIAGEDVNRKDHNGTSYFDGNITARFTFTEANAIFTEDGTIEGLNISLSTESGSVTDDYKKKIETALTDWDVSGGKYTCEVTLSEDTQYTFNVNVDEYNVNVDEYKDEAGWPINLIKVVENEDKQESVVVDKLDVAVVDKVNPSVKVWINEETVWEKLFDVVSFGIFSKDEITINYEATDDVSKIVYLGYTIADPESDAIKGTNDNIETLKGYLKGQEFTAIREESYDNPDKSISGEIPPLTPNQRSAVYFKVVDASGHVDYYNSAGVIVEDILPVITITNLNDFVSSVEGIDYKIFGAGQVDEAGNETPVYVNFNVKDGDKDSDIWSGISEITYEIIPVGNKTETEKHTFTIDTSKKDDQRGALLVDENNSELFVGENGLLPVSIPVDREKFNSNKVTVKITAKDIAGNENVEEVSFAIDKTAPEITATYDNNPVSNDKYFNADRKLTLNFTERNFDREDVIISVDYTDDLGNAATYSYSYDSETNVAKLVNGEKVLATVNWIDDNQADKQFEYLTDSRVNTAEITFDLNGDYVIKEISCKDINDISSGNLAKITEPDFNFTIDKNKPIVSYEANIKLKEAYKSIEGVCTYYSSTRVDQFTITEHNYSSSTEEEKYMTCDVIIKLGSQEPDENIKNKTNNVEIVEYELSKLLDPDNKEYEKLPFSVKYDKDESSTDNYVYQIIFEPDAYYYVDDIVCTDLASWQDENTENTGLFCVDGTTADLGVIEITSAMNQYVDIDTGFDGSYEVKPTATPETDDVIWTWDNENGKWQSNTDNNQSIEEWFISQNKLAVNISGFDALSGIESISYYQSIKTNNEPLEVVTTEEGMKDVDWKEADLNDSQEFNSLKASFVIDNNIGEGQKTLIYLKIVNNAGLISYYVTDGVMVDKIMPTITIRNSADLEGKIFKANILLDVEIDDDESTVWSGVQKVWYEITSTGNNKNNSYVGIMYEDDGNTAGREKLGKVNIPGEILVDKLTDFNTNNVTVQVFAMDVAGNMAVSKSVNFAIDTTIPTIAASYDNNTALNARYFKEDRTLTVVFTERNFAYENAEIRFNYTSDNTSVPTEYIIRNGIRNIVSTTGDLLATIEWEDSQADTLFKDLTNERTVTARIHFTAEGDYDITGMVCADTAVWIESGKKKDTVGNSTNDVVYADGTVAATNFTFDKTQPVIELSYDNNSAKNGNFYNEVRTATVKITEHNFKADEVAEDIKAKLNGAGITAPVMSAFTSNGNVHTATIKYLADGDYTFDIEYTDLAGNKADDFTADSFTVDTVAPEIEFFDIEDKSANNGVVSPGIRYSDINYDKESVSIKVVGANNGPVSIERIRSSIENGQAIKLNDFAHIEEMDDLYTITVVITDKAGNETEKEIQFSVNRFGSVYVFGSEECENWVEEVYHNEEAEIYIKEINVDIVEESVVSVSLDGELKELVVDNDYTATKGSTNTGWSEVHYKLSPDNFSDEGNYKVTFSSKDRAGNSMDNENARKEGAQCNVEFVIDKTAPTIVIGGVIDDKQYFESSRTVTVDAQDAIALKEVVVDINGEEVIYTVDVDAEAGNKKPLKDAKNHQNEIKEIISSHSDWQEVSVVATDMAGNVYAYGEKEPGDGGTPIRVLITKNLFIQYYKNTPLFIGSIIGILVIAGVIVFLVSKKKKDNQA